MSVTANAAAIARGTTTNSVRFRVAGDAVIGAESTGSAAFKVRAALRWAVTVVVGAIDQQDDRRENDQRDDQRAGGSLSAHGKSGGPGGSGPPPSIAPIGTEAPFGPAATAR